MSGRCTVAPTAPHGRVNAEEPFHSLCWVTVYDRRESLLMISVKLLNIISELMHLHKLTFTTIVLGKRQKSQRQILKTREHKNKTRLAQQETNAGKCL